jgi:carboxypeptidase T
MKNLIWAILLLSILALLYPGQAEAQSSVVSGQWSVVSTQYPISNINSPVLSFDKPDRALNQRPHSPVPSPQSPFIVRIDFENRDELAVLAGVLDIWEVNHTEGYVIAMITLDQWSWLKLLGYPVTVDEIRTDELNRPRQRDAGQTAGIPGYACYRTVEETHSSLAALATHYPNIAEWKDIGDSYDKATPGGPAGYEIHALVLTNKAIAVEKGKLVLLAAVHAREYTTAELATRFAEKLVSGYGVDPDLTWLLDYNEIHIIAQGNPDGRKWAEQGYSWRKNTNPAGCGFPSYGVDLNRNGSFLWAGCPSGGCSSSDPCSILYRGTAPASEPETQAAQNYLHTVFADQRGPGINDAAPLDTNGVFISLHSYGNLVIYSWDFTGQDAPNIPELRRLGRKFGYINRYSVCNTSNCLYAVDGSHTDYAYGTFGVATYTVELGTSFFQSCSYFENTILQTNLDALVYAAKAARRPYRVAAGPDTIALRVSASSVVAGTAVTLTARADDTRFFSNGYGPVEPSQTIAAVRYTVDRPSWAGGTPTALIPTDGAFDSSTEDAHILLDTQDWEPGRYLLFVEGQDTAGNWGAPTAIFLTITASYGLAFAQETPGSPLAAGQMITHTLTVTNTGGISDQFALSVEQSTWPISVADVTPVVDAGSRVHIPVTVQVPSTVTLGAADVAIVRIHSMGDTAQVRIATLPLVVTAEPGVTDGGSTGEMVFYFPLIYR